MLLPTNFLFLRHIVFNLKTELYASNIMGINHDFAWPLLHQTIVNYC